MTTGVGLIISVCSPGIALRLMLNSLRSAPRSHVVAIERHRVTVVQSVHADTGPYTSILTPRLDRRDRLRLVVVFLHVFADSDIPRSKLRRSDDSRRRKGRRRRRGPLEGMQTRRRGKIKLVFALAVVLCTLCPYGIYVNGTLCQGRHRVRLIGYSTRAGKDAKR